jgi:hypothetical protein
MKETQLREKKQLAALAIWGKYGKGRVYRSLCHAVRVGCFGGGLAVGWLIGGFEAEFRARLRP